MFGEVKGKGQLLTATNTWAFSVNEKESGSRRGTGLSGDGYVVKIDTAHFLR